MSNANTDYVKPIANESHKNVYKYVQRDSFLCPVCNTPIVKNNYDTRYDEVKHCYPFSRLLIKGIFWWKKYCPIDGIHFHMRCKKCNVSWIMTHSENADIREIPF